MKSYIDEEIVIDKGMLNVRLATSDDFFHRAKLRFDI
jgi:hypothetical protein